MPLQTKKNPVPPPPSNTSVHVAPVIVIGVAEKVVPLHHPEVQVPMPIQYVKVMLALTGIELPELALDTAL